MLQVHGQAVPFARVQGISDRFEETGRVGRGGECGDAPETAGAEDRQRVGLSQLRGP